MEVSRSVHARIRYKSILLKLIILTRTTPKVLLALEALSLSYIASVIVVMAKTATI